MKMQASYSLTLAVQVAELADNSWASNETRRC